MSHNTLIHRIVRPAIRAVAPTGVTPNQITTLRLMTGLGAAALYASGSPFWFHAAGVVFLLSMLLDRADGELARQTGQMSLAGYRYDLWSDCISGIAVFIGIGLGLGVASPESGTANFWLGCIAGVGIAVLFWQLNVVKLAPVQGYSFFGGRIVFDPDDAMAAVPVLVWLGLAKPMLIAAAVITPLIAIWLALLPLRTKNRQRADQ